MKPRADQHYDRIYGWTEQNQSSWGIETHVIDLCPSEDEVTLDQYGRLCGLSRIDGPAGDWFLTYREAKRACLEYWRDRLSMARRALKDIRGQKKE